MLKLYAIATALLPSIAAQSCTLDPCVRDQYVAAMTTACSAASTQNDSNLVGASLCRDVFSNTYQQGPKCDGRFDASASPPTTTCSWAVDTIFGQDKFNGLRYHWSISTLCAAGSASASDCTTASANVVSKVNDCAGKAPLTANSCHDNGFTSSLLPLAVGTAACVYDAGAVQASHACNDASASTCTIPAGGCIVNCVESTAGLHTIMRVTATRACTHVRVHSISVERLP
jgi:hypothetical protein